MGIVSPIDDAFKSVGIDLIRDIRDVGYRQSLSEFMRKISKCDFVLMIVSEHYLKSRNCMFEATQAMKNAGFKERILPIVLESAKIYDAQTAIEYLRYWEAQCETLKEQILLSDPANSIPFAEELKIVKEIAFQIGEFIAIMRDMNCLTLKQHQHNNYRCLLEAIGLDADVFQKLLEISMMEDSTDQDIALETFLCEHPNNNDGMFLKAHLANRRGENVKALAFYGLLLKLYPQDAMAHNNLALILEEHYDEIDRARAHFEKAIEINSKDWVSHYNLGRILSFNYKEYSLSLAHLIKSSELNPNDGDIWGNLGLTSEQMGNYEDAEIYYKKAILVNPNFAPAYDSLALLLLQQGQYDDAIKHYLKAIELEPDNQNYYNNFGLLLGCVHIRDKQGAIKAFQRALEIKPDYVAAKVNLDQVQNGLFFTEFYSQNFIKAINQN